MMDESKLIFIVSQPRSGSTLTQKILSNNTYVDTVSEPWILLPFLSIYKPQLLDAGYNYPVAIKGFFDYLEKKNSTEQFTSEYKKFILSLYKVSDPNQLFIDKTPRYYEILPEIIDLFPDAKFLILKRNPFASLHSMISTWSGGKIDFKLFMRFYRDFLVAPFLIQEFCEKNISLTNVFQVKYEDIVSAPERVVERIYKWLDIPFTASVLNIEKNDKVKGIYGDDVYKREPLKNIQVKRADSWREMLEDKELAAFFSDYQKYLSEEFIKKYGYSTEKFNTGLFRLGKNKFGEYISLLKAADKKMP